MQEIRPRNMEPPKLAHADFRVHCIRQEALWKEGSIAEWINGREFSHQWSNMYENQPLPGVDDFDMLVVMGGEMNVYEEDAYPWLAEQKRLIAEAVERDKRVFGVCLGAQLMSVALGGEVYKNPEKELGWHVVTLNDDAKDDPLFGDCPAEIRPFMWHDDAFTLPESAVNLGGSQACANQIMRWGRRAYGVQFHPEVTMDSLMEAFNEHAEDIQNATGPHCQNVSQMVADPNMAPRIQELLFTWLDRLVEL